MTSVYIRTVVKCPHSNQNETPVELITESAHSIAYCERLAIHEHNFKMAERPSLQMNLSDALEFPGADNGNFPCVCMNENGTAVLVYQSSGQIFYIVGCLSSTTDQQQGLRLDWGSPIRRGKGCNVQAAINNYNEIVIVYSKNWARVCRYKGGTVQQNARTINWWENESCKLANGVNPTVALRDRTAIFIHEASYGSYRAFYRIGEIRENKIWMTDEHRLRALDGYKQISVAVNSSGQVLFTCRGTANSHLYYTVGQLTGSELKNIPVKVWLYGYGYFNHISLLDDNHVIAVHESWSGSDVMLKPGRIRVQQALDTVDWEEEQRVDTGYRITAAVNNSNQMIVVIVRNRTGYGEGALMYKFGSMITNAK